MWCTRQSLRACVLAANQRRLRGLPRFMKASANYVRDAASALFYCGCQERSHSCTDCGASRAGLAPTYEAVCAEMGWPIDTAKLEAMRGVNAAKLEELEAAIKDAEENMGDIEIRDARLAKADYLCKLGAYGHGCSERRIRALWKHKASKHSDTRLARGRPPVQLCGTSHSIHTANIIGFDTNNARPHGGCALDLRRGQDAATVRKRWC